MRTAIIALLALVLTTGVAFPQAGTGEGGNRTGLNPGTATDLQRLDTIGPNPIAQLMKSAAAGNVDSQLRLGLAFQNGEDYKTGEQVTRNPTEAIKWFGMAAEQGLDNAQVTLAKMYASGQRFKQDLKEALKWYRKAADQGNADAQASLGGLYFDGRGVERSYTDALNWYRKAAEHDHPTAQFNMAIMYYKGQGVPADVVQAHMWAELAADSSTGAELNEAVKLRDTIKDGLTAAQIAESKRISTEWKARPR